MSSTLATERQTTKKNIGVALNSKLHRLYISFSQAIKEQLLGLHWFCHIQKLRLRSVCETQRLLTGTGLVRVAPVGIRPVQRFNDAALRNRWWALILNTHLLYILELTPKHKVKAFIMETGSIWYAISGPHRVTCFMAAGCEQRGRKKSPGSLCCCSFIRAMTAILYTLFLETGEVCEWNVLYTVKNGVATLSDMRM